MGIRLTDSQEQWANGKDAETHEAGDTPEAGGRSRVEAVDEIADSAETAESRESGPDSHPSV
jgi:hypothetical protein